MDIDYKDKYLIIVYVMYPDGVTPIPNVLINGIKTSAGTEGCTTNASGATYGFADNANVTLVSGTYVDLIIQKSVTAVKGDSVSVTITAIASNYRLFTSTTNVKFSPLIKTIDVSAVTGGEDGQNGYPASYNSDGYPEYEGGYGGYGGRGGNLVVKTGITVTPNTQYRVTIGSRVAHNGAAQSTSAFGVTSNTFRSTRPRRGGDRYDYGDGGDGGVSGFYSSFTAVSKVGGSGGSGGMGDVNTLSNTWGSGGSGNGSGGSGGRGGYGNQDSEAAAKGYNGSNATAFGSGGGGGGGGGGTTMTYVRTGDGGTGGSGKNGAVAIRMHH